MEVQTISLDQLLPPVVIMREEMDPEAFRELVADIRIHGLLSPIIVTPHEDKYRVVAGWRRKCAAERAELLEVPCRVLDLDEAGEIMTMMRENLHREDPNAADEGKMFAVMHEGLHLTIEGIAERTGKSAGYIRTRLAVVRGPSDVLEALRARQITVSVAMELQRCTHEADRQYCLYYAKDGGATTATVHRWVNERNLNRLAGEMGPAPVGAPAPVDATPELLGRCEWHRGQVPLDGTLSFHVCGPCYTAITHLRDELAKQPTGQEGNDHGVAST